MAITTDHGLIFDLDIILSVLIIELKIEATR